MEKSRSLLILLGTAHSLNHSLFLIVPPLLTLVVTDIGSTFEQVGLAATLALIMYGAGSMIGGPLSDRIGSIRVIQIGCFVVGASTLVMLRSFDISTFAIGMILVSFGASFYHPTANHLITEVYQGRVGKAMGIHGALGNLGQVLTPAVAFWLGILFGWRMVFVFFGGLTAMVGVLFGAAKVHEGHTSQKDDLYRIGYLVRDRGLLIAILYIVLSALSYQGIVFFFPTFLLLQRTLHQDIAAYAYSMMLLVGVAGEFLGGIASDRYGSKRGVVMTNIGALFGLIALLVVPLTPLAVVLFILIYGISVFGNEPSVTSLVGGITPEEYSGRVFGIMFCLSFGLGSVSTTIAGYFADHYGLTASYWVMATILAVAAIVSFGMPTKRLRS